MTDKNLMLLLTYGIGFGSLAAVLFTVQYFQKRNETKKRRAAQSNSSKKASDHV